MNSCLGLIGGGLATYNAARNIVEAKMALPCFIDGALFPQRNSTCDA
jgi:hypothetical protein